MPSDNNPEKDVNFRGLIITKCQNQFETGKSDEQLMKMENELADTNDAVSTFIMVYIVDSTMLYFFYCTNFNTLHTYA